MNVNLGNPSLGIAKKPLNSLNGFRNNKMDGNNFKVENREGTVICRNLVAHMKFKQKYIKAFREGHFHRKRGSQYPRRGEWPPSGAKLSQHQWPRIQNAPGAHQSTVKP